jgi:hypothetical protein
MSVISLTLGGAAAAGTGNGLANTEPIRKPRCRLKNWTLSSSFIPQLAPTNLPGLIARQPAFPFFLAISVSLPMMIPHDGTRPKAEYSEPASCVAGPVGAGFGD